MHQFGKLLATPISVQPYIIVSVCVNKHILFVIEQCFYIPININLFLSTPVCIYLQSPSTNFPTREVRERGVGKQKGQKISAAK